MTTTSKSGGGYMYFNLKSYLGDLEAAEAAKPVTLRRHVPTLTELAAAAGIHKVTMSKMVQGRIRSLNFDVGQKIVAELRRCGFNTQPGDLLGYKESEG
jgi:DNA-binding Xre family transcriptional regulator